MAETATATEQLLRVDPGTLIIADNIRKDVKLDPAFVSSIKQHGVLEPILVEPAENGAWSVIDGQLRTLAAIDTGRADVPVVTRPQREAAARLIEQLVVNDHRSGVTDADRTAAHQALFDLGVPASTIAKKTNTPIKRVQQALVVAGSKVASEVMGAGNVTLDQAAALADFEDDPEVAATLVSAALQQPHQFDHVLARATATRNSNRQRAGLLEELDKAGYLITEEIDPYVCNATISSIAYLFTDEELTTHLADDHSTWLTPFDGLKVVVQSAYEWDGTSRVEVWKPYFVVDGWKELGYHVQAWRLREEKPAGGGLTDAEKEERRLTRTNNKLWVPATTVRIAFIKELLQRKTPPAGWELFVADFVGRTNSSDEHSLALAFLGHEGRGYGAEWVKKNPTKAVHYLIAMALADAEGDYEFGKTGWRREKAPAHLAQLAKWGYTLSELEESVAKKASK